MKAKATNSNMVGITSYVAETIEQKVRRIVNNKEPIKDGSPLLYQERKDGVQPSYNIKTDRWDVAVEAMDKVTKSYHATNYRDWETDRKSTRLNSSHITRSRMPSSA